jgi:hypothetical protein
VVLRESGTVLKFCDPELIFDGTDGVGYLFMFCAPRLFLGSTVGVGSHYYVLCARTRFRRYRGRLVPFSCYALPFSFLAVPWASFVFHTRIQFRRHRGSWVSFSCFALADLFSVVPRAPHPVFMFCAPGLIFGGTKSAGSSFHVLRSRTRYRRYRGRWDLF